MSKKTPNTPPWMEAGTPHIWHPYAQMQTAPPPLSVARTEGCRIILEDGRELIDGVASWWSAAHGYNHPHLVAAATAQLETMPHVMFGGLAHEPAYRLATRLSAITPGRGALSRVFFSDSGSTAVEVALKMALQYWSNRGQAKKDRFICFHDGYHGDTLGAMAVSDPERGMHKAFRHNVIHHYALEIPTSEYGFSEFADTLEAIAPRVAGLIIEPLVQGAGGMKCHSADTLAEIHRLCAQHDILFIADEVMTGFGRSGMLFACEEAGIVPDILCLGKALTGGIMPLAATLTKEAVFEAFLDDNPQKALMHGPTFMANPLACTIAGASLDLFEREDRLAQVAAIERHFYEALMPLRTLPGVTDVRVKGAIGVVELSSDHPTITATQYQRLGALRQSFIEQGVWVRPFGNIIALLPPLVIEENDLQMLTAAAEHVLRQPR